jgi:hypothetical protein
MVIFARDEMHQTGALRAAFPCVRLWLALGCRWQGIMPNLGLVAPNAVHAALARNHIAAISGIAAHLVCLVMAAPARSEERPTTLDAVARVFSIRNHLGAQISPYPEVNGAWLTDGNLKLSVRRLGHVGCAYVMARLNSSVVDMINFTRLTRKYEIDETTLFYGGMSRPTAYYQFRIIGNSKGVCSENYGHLECFRDLVTKVTAEEADRLLDNLNIVWSDQDCAEWHPKQSPQGERID